MKSFFDLREAVKSADKKPETYIGPDGKPKIRMVPVDREVVKEALYDVSWGIGAEKQVVAKDAAEAIRKAKAEILKSKPKLADPKYSDTWKKNPSVHKIREQAEDDMPASPDEKSMAMKQAKFIEYVAGEIEEYLEKNKSFPEWMQNKLSALHEKAKDMHAVLAGEYDDDEDEMKEARKYTAPTKAEIDTDRKKDQKGKPRPSITSKSTSDKQYGGMKVGLKTEEKDPRIKAAGVSGYNKPKATPGHPQKSHIVVAKDGDKVKTIRFGQAGVTTAGAPKEGESEKQKQRRKSFKARHADNIAKGKMSAAYWADKVKW